MRAALLLPPALLWGALAALPLPLGTRSSAWRPLELPTPPTACPQPASLSLLSLHPAQTWLGALSLFVSGCPKMTQDKFSG